MDTSKLDLIVELDEFLSMHRHCLTSDEIKLLNQVIEELEQVDKLTLSPEELVFYLARISELILRLFHMN